MSKTCAYCDKIIFNDSQGRSRTFCSYSCSAKGRKLEKKGVFIPCVSCGLIIYKTKSLLRTYNYCSYRCSATHKNLMKREAKNKLLQLATSSSES